MQKSRLGIVITWFQGIFEYEHWIWLNIGPTQSVLRFFARNFVQTCLGAPGSGWSRKKRVIVFLSTVNAYQYLTSLEVWSGHIFGASASPRSLTKKQAMTPSFTVHGRQHDTKWVTFELLLHAAFVADEIWGFMLEPGRRADCSTLNLVGWCPSKQINGSLPSAKG